MACSLSGYKILATVHVKTMFIFLLGVDFQGWLTENSMKRQAFISGPGTVFCNLLALQLCKQIPCRHACCASASLTKRGKDGKFKTSLSKMSKIIIVVSSFFFPSYILITAVKLGQGEIFVWLLEFMTCLLEHPCSVALYFRLICFSAMS